MLGQLIHDLTVAVGFFTRLPLAPALASNAADLARATWAAPVVGGVIGLIGAAIYALTYAAGVPPWAAATLAIAGMLVATGALHEDGLADTADGFGGGRDRDQKLAIMRDSRIGTYGVCALVLALMLRIAALAALAEPALVAPVLIAAQAGARAPLAGFMLLVQPARPDGLSASAGIPPPASALAGAALGLVALLIGLGAAKALAALLLMLVASLFLAWLCVRQIGGQTGDVLGALEQVCEVAILLVAAASKP